MRRLRTLRSRSCVMPLLLAALVFRVLVLPGFAMGGSGSMSLQGSMCTTTAGKIEKIELPGSGQPHCEYCVAPPLGVPFANLPVGLPPRATGAAFTPIVTPAGGFTLVRAQSARAPPRA